MLDPYIKQLTVIMKIQSLGKICWHKMLFEINQKEGQRHVSEFAYSYSSQQAEFEYVQNPNYVI